MQTVCYDWIKKNICSVCDKKEDKEFCKRCEIKEIIDKVKFKEEQLKMF